MEMRRGEVGAFVAIAGGTAATVALSQALDGLGHRHDGAAHLGALLGRDPGVEAFEGGLVAAREGLSRSRIRAARGVLAVGGSAVGNGSAPQLLAAGRVAEHAVIACLTGAFHNGEALAEAVVERGALMGGGGDAELLLHLMAQSRQRTIVNRLLEALERVVGGFSLVVLTDDLLVAARDPRGFRPLWVGARGESWLVASEAEALHALGAVGLRELGVGELVLLEPGAPARSLRPWAVYPRAACALEWVCLARPGGSFEGQAVHAVRQRLGRALAATAPAPVDVVAALPGVCAAGAMAFAGLSGLALEQVFEPALHEADTSEGAPVLRPVTAAVRGQRVALVFAPDTALERLRAAVSSLKRAGARQVHLRCYAPMLAHECPYGQRLPASARGGLDVSALQAWLKVDSLAWIGLDALAAALGREGSGVCAHCLGGAPPLEARDAAATPQLPLFEGAGSGTVDGMLV